MIQGVWGMEDPSNKTTCEAPTCRRLCPCLTGGRGIKLSRAIALALCVGWHTEQWFLAERLWGQKPLPHKG